MPTYIGSSQVTAIYLGSTSTAAYFNNSNIVAIVLTLSGIAPSGIIGGAYSFAPTRTNGTGPFTFTSSGFTSTGLSVNATTGVVSGTYSGAAGTLTASITVTDSLNATSTLPVSIVMTASGAEMVGGFAIGQAAPSTPIYGSTMNLDGLKLTGGDDFNTAMVPATWWNGRNPTGKYSSPHLSNAIRGTNESVDYHMLVDPYWRGVTSQSPTDLNQNAVTISGGYATMTAFAPPAPILPFLPTTYGARGDAQGRPQLLSGSLKTAPHYMLSAQADFAVVVKFRYTTGIATGSWPSFWTSTFFWPDYGEIDIFEGKQNVAGNYSSANNVIASDTDGGGAATSAVASGIVPNGRPVLMAAVKRGSRVTFYDDFATEGVMVGRGFVDNARVLRIRGAHDIRLDHAISSGWDGTTFDISGYPKAIDFDFWQAWTPVAGGNKSDAVVLSPVNVTAGGAWTATLPSTTSLFGSGAGLEQVSGAYDNFDAPGYTSRNTTTKIPGGMSVDLTTRQITGTVPSVYGGRVFVMLMYSYDDGTPAKRVFLPFNVAPINKNLFTSIVLSSGAAFDQTIAYTDVHSGNLGHTYNVVVTGGSWLTVTGNGGTSPRIQGTAPNADTTLTVTITATNSIGQTLTVVRTVGSQAAVTGFDPTTWGSVIEWWDFNNATKVFTGSTGTGAATPDVSKIGSVVGLKAGYLAANGTTAAQPTYVTAANGKKAAKFTRANTTRLTAVDAPLAATADGEDNAYAIVFAAKRGTPGVLSTVCSFIRDSAATTADGIRHNFTAADAVSISRQSNGTTVSATTASSVVPTDVWSTISIIFAGTTVTMRKDGVVVLDAAPCDAASIPLTKFSMGGFLSSTNKTWDGTLAFDGMIGEIGVLDAIATTDTTLVQAENYLMAKWTN